VRWLGVGRECRDWESMGEEGRGGLLGEFGEGSTEWEHRNGEMRGELDGSDGRSGRGEGKGWERRKG